jgi:hypothetical protein
VSENHYALSGQITDRSKESMAAPCPDCGREYTFGENVEVRVQERPEPVWTGCIDCWVRRTSPEVCATFDATTSEHSP